MKTQRPQLAKAIVRKNKPEVITLCGSKLYYKATVNKTVWYDIRHINSGTEFRAQK